MKRLIVPIMCLVAGFVLWHLAAAYSGIPQFLLPAPHTVLLELWGRPLVYLEHLFVTLATTILGYVVAIALSFALVAIFTWSKILERVLYPYLLTIKITPTIALSPLLILWLGVGMVSKLIIVVLICFFPIFVGTLKGFRSADPEAVDLFRSLSANVWQTMRYLRLPSAMPYVFPALKVSVLLALTGALLGEFIASTKGLGYMAMFALRTYDSTVLFASILVLVACGFVLFGLVSLVEKRVVFWQRSSDLL
jgi:NitT/TauT family transport system permease protein